MQELYPNYYQKFSCIAGRCIHSCCIGWEIDIDDETMARYEAMQTPMGDKIRKHIEGDDSHFILGPEERCPFLQEDGLCELIIECGEDVLCDICRLHPRFRNFYENAVETGLGLCCEEAARIIITEQEKFSIPLPRDNDLTEEAFFAIRDTIFYILQEREKSIYDRFCSLAKKFGLSFSFNLTSLQKVYLSLERLDETWTEYLTDLEGFAFDEAIFRDDAFSIPFEQLSVYFIFRHLTDAMWDGDYESRVRFALMSVYMIGALWANCKQKKGELSPDDMIEIARLYSSEIEYSEENTEALMNL